MSDFKPTVAPSLLSIIDNMRRAVPELKDVDPWRIEMAHRNWSVSEDFGKDEEFVHWLPEDTDEKKFEYMTIQLSDKSRTIAELEKYNSSLQKTINAQKDEFDRLR